MSNKKFGKLAVLSVLGLLSLTACNSSKEIVAKPSNYDDEIVTIEGSEEDIQNNVLSIIYDALHDGSIDSKVLDTILYEYAQSVFGTFNKVTYSGKDENVITLEAAAANAKLPLGSDYTIANTFIKNHKVYWFTNDEGVHVDDQGQPIEDDKNYTPGIAERAKVVAKWEAISDRIAENMYTKVSGGSYSSKHFFDELKFVKSLYEAGQKVDYAQAKEDRENGQLPKVIIDYTIEKKDVFSSGVLNYEYYKDEGEDRKVTYIEDEIVPAVYGDLLIEQYLLDEELAAVRNSRARQINVIKIEKYSSFANNADALVNHLVSDIYARAPEASAEHVDTTVNEKTFEELFDTYATISKGLIDEIEKSESATKIIDDLHKIASDIYRVETGKLSGKSYYANTTYGDLVKDYEKFLKAKTYEELDKTLYDKFTSSGTTTHQEGFDQEVITIDQKESITKGWYIQGNAPSLDSNSEITNRLFKLSVANSKVEIGKAEDGVEQKYIDKGIAEIKETDRYVLTNEGWKIREKAADGENKYLCSINGAYFLKFEGQYSKDDWKKDIVYDDGSAYYIVQVVEAVKDVKLRNHLSDNSYANTRGEAFLNEVVDIVSKLVGETGNYASLSKEHWLKQMDIKYHDQKVYDYFKENYPDLFE